MRTFLAALALSIAALASSGAPASAQKKEIEFYPVGQQVTCLPHLGRCRTNAACCSGNCVNMGDLYGLCQ